MRRLLAFAVLAVSASAAATAPNGARPARPRATQVLVRAADLDARGVSIRLAPGVGIVASGPGRAGKILVTVTGAVEIAGRLDARALGLRVERDTDLLDSDGGAVLGRARAGALVSSIRSTPTRTLIESPAAIRGRFTVATDALGAEPHDLVFPVPDGELAALRASADLRAAPGPKAPVRATLDPAARVELLGKTEDASWLHVRTYGALAIDGWLPADRLSPTPPAAEAPPSRGLKPTHEVLVDAPAFADREGKRPIGTLRGGTLVAASVEVSSLRVRVMTHGDVVGEVWTPAASLRPLEASVWAEGSP